MKFLIALLITLVISAATISAQTTAFTYQGKLTDGSVPANGVYTMQFDLFAGSSGGTVLATQSVPAVSVANGIFTVNLDFGGGVFDGSNRYLEITVAGTPLTPRQQITSSPYSIRTLSAGTADGLTNLCVGCVTNANITSVSGAKVTGTVASAASAGTAVNVSGVVAIANGGTGATNPSIARANLGLGSLSTVTPTGTAGTTTFLRGDNSWAAASVDIVASINTQFSIDDRSGWTHFENLSEDICVLNIPLGFTFTGWGRSNTTVSISSNGVFFFGQDCSTSLNNAGLPSGISADPFVALFWDDLKDYGSSEYIEYQTSGTAPGRVFNLYFRNRLFSSVCGTDVVNIMMAIHESSNLVRVSYSAMSTCAQMRGSSATFGMQGPGGAAARVFNAGTNSPILDDNADRNMISYLPPSQ